jgi:predicted DNA-binding transcriptional regulator YafY
MNIKNSVLRRPGPFETKTTECRKKRLPLGRIRRIYDALQAGKYPNCSILAAQLEVSRKCILRDIQYMRDGLDMPIEYDAFRGGYWFSKPVDRFPGMALTQSELFALRVANKALGQYRGTPFHQPLRTVAKKLTRHLDSLQPGVLDNFDQTFSLRPFAPEDTDVHDFDLVTTALQERRTLAFEYRKPGQIAPAPRTLQPYHLTCVDSRWYVIGQDPLRGGVRTFALGRMGRLELTSQRFIKPAEFNLERYLQGSFTVMKGAGNYDVHIEFDPWAADLVRGRVWHRSR